MWIALIVGLVIAAAYVAIANRLVVFAIKIPVKTKSAEEIAAEKVIEAKKAARQKWVEDKLSYMKKGEDYWKKEWEPGDEVHPDADYPGHFLPSGQDVINEAAKESPIWAFFLSFTKAGCSPEVLKRSEEAEALLWKAINAWTSRSRTPNQSSNPELPAPPCPDDSNL